MENTAMAREWIERHLQQVRWRDDDEANLRCPLPEHGDAHPSATVNARKRVWRCHGCGADGTLTDLASRLGIDPPVYLRNDADRTRAPATTTVYEYLNAAGEPVFEVVRRVLPDGRKTFRQRHRPAECAPYVWKAALNGKGLIYRLPQVLEAVQAGKPVLVVEGEKDADRLATLGFAATCNAGGAEKWTRNHASHLPPRSKVYVLPDSDASGIAHREKVCRSLLSQGCEVYAIDPKDYGYQIEAKHGKDVSDWLDDDPARGSGALRELLDRAVKREATTKPQKAASQPLPAPKADDPRPVILCSRGGRDEWTRAAVKVLVEAGLRKDRQSLYGSVRLTPGETNAGYVVSLTLVEESEPYSWLTVPRSGTLQLRPASARTVCRQLDREGRWFVERRDRYGNSTFEPSNATLDDAEHVLETYRDDLLDDRVSRPRLRTLRGVVDAPTLRPDGTVIDRPGYDESTWLYVNIDPKLWKTLPVNPTRADARAAVKLLYDLVAETPFAEPIHRATWLALVLSMVGRFYIAGNVPLFAFTANAPGVGKGTLVDLATIIATGRPAPKWAPVSGRTVDAEAEERKRLVAVGLDGTPCVCIDNIKAGDPLGTPALDSALTCGQDRTLGFFADRMLGKTATLKVPWSCVLTATGNNLVVVGDMARRTLMCRLTTNNPDPETLVYRHHPRIAEYCMENRVELLTAVLTILVAHHNALARGEAEPLPTIASYGGWSDHARSPVAWADPDGCDPWASNAEVKADAQPEEAEMLTFLGAWHTAFGSREVVVKDIERACREDEPDYNAALAEAVADLGLPRPHGMDRVNTRALGRRLAARKEHPGPYIVREGRRYPGKPVRWYVEKPPKPIPLDLNAVFVVEWWKSPEILDLLEKYPDDDRPPEVAERLKILLWEAAREATPDDARRLRARPSPKEAVELPPDGAIEDSETGAQGIL